MVQLSKYLLQFFLYQRNSLGYSFYFQKQPGLDWKNFKFVINGKEKITVQNRALNIVESSVLNNLNRIGDLYVFDEVLKKDFEVKIKFKNQ